MGKKCVSFILKLTVELILHYLVSKFDRTRLTKVLDLRCIKKEVLLGISIPSVNKVFIFLTFLEHLKEITVPFFDSFVVF